jgi:hypothetical protein
MVNRPLVKRAILRSYNRVEGRALMTRFKVMEGLQRAAEMAETMSDPAGMVSAWREIGKMCGYYAVETKKVEVSINGEVQVRKLAALSDEDLLKLATGQTLEGEFAQVLEATLPEEEL